MRRLGPVLLLVAVALLAGAAWLVLSPTANERRAAGSGGDRRSDPGNAVPGAAVVDASNAERTAEPAAESRPSTGPNSVRGRVRFAADDRPASAVRVRAFAKKPPLRPMKVSQEIRRQSRSHPAAEVQDLSEFELNQGGQQEGGEEARSAAGGADASGNGGDAPKEGEAKPKRESRDLADDPLVVVTTRTDGTFEITGRSEKELFLDALTSGFVSDGDARVDFAAAPAREGVVLSLVAGARLGGHVYDEEGRPVAGATVLLSVAFDVFSVFSSGGMEVCPPAATRTDAQGAWLFEALPAPRSVQLRATNDGFAPTPPQKVDLRPGEERSLDVLLAHGATINVHVTDETGAPVPDAKLNLEPTRLDFANIGPDMQRAFGDRRTPDADGRVRFTGVAPGEWRVRAVAPQRLDDTKSVTAGGPGSSLEVELRLAKGRTLASLVVAADGTPIAQARVAAYADPSLMNMQAMIHAGERRWQKTDDQGRVTLTGLPDGKLVCEAHAKGYRDGRVELDKAASECRLELASRGEIDGVVVSKKTGKPMTRFDVKVVRERKLTGFMDPAATTSLIDLTVPFATPNGKFRLTGVNPGRLRLVVLAAEHGEAATDWLDVAEAEVKKGVVVFLEAEAIIEGTVVEADGGAPVEGASVERTASSNPLEEMMARIFAVEPIHTDAQGRFRIGGLAAGTARFVAAKDGFIEAATGDLELSAGQTTSNLRLELTRGGEIWGVVNDANGSPQPGASVMCQETARMKMRNVKSDEHGEYHVKGLPAGTFAVVRMPTQINLGGDDYVAEMTNAIETHTVRLKAGETQRVDFAAGSKGGATIEGRVTQGGSPVARSLVRVFTTVGGDADAGSGLKQATTADDGTFKVTGLMPGSGFVQANGAGYGMNGTASAAAVAVRLTEGETTRVELVIPTGGLRGKVVDAATGAPLANVAVYAASSDPGSNVLELATRRAAAVHTDTNGAFLVPHLRDGRYVLTAGASDFTSSAPADHAVARTAPLDVAGGREGDAGTIRLPRGGQIEGTITDGTGKALASASVFLRGGDGEFLEEWSATTSDASGHFTYGGVPNGTWDVVARAPGHAVAVARSIHAAEGSVVDVRLKLLGGTEVFADVGEVAVERLFNLRVEVEGPDGRIPLTLFGMGDLTDLLNRPPRLDVVRLGRFSAGDYRVHGSVEGKSFEKKFTLKGEPELHVPVELPK